MRFNNSFILRCIHSNTITNINKAPLMKSQSVKLTNALEQRQKELAKIARYKQAVWQDWKNGEISHIEYHHMKDDYDRQTAELEQIAETLEKEKAELEKEINTKIRS